MIAKIIRLCMGWPVLVLLITLLLLAWGGRALLNTPVDAIPDLSDVQVIVRVDYPGQAPDLVEKQVTYPLSTLLMSAPGVQTVRGYSFYGDAYLYVIFADDVDLYWARSRVMEYLNQAESQLPSEATMALGPDASGVGWVYQYALLNRNNTMHLGELTRLQDWFISQELQAIPGVSEVAKVGGMVQSYQVVVDPLKLLHYGLSLDTVRRAILMANGDAGGSVIELAEAEYMVRSQGYLTDLADFETIPLGIVNAEGTPLLLRDIATVRLGPETRRGVAEWNGEGEVVGGIVIMRDGENALRVTELVREKLRQLQKSLPEGVEIVTAYDRSALVQRAVDNLSQKLWQEMLVVVLVCGLFLWKARATLVVAISLPAAFLLGFGVMQLLGISANLMSLGGIAIAIGALVDAAIVMVENVQKRLENPLEHDSHWSAVTKACIEVGPALFISLLIITLSFVPVFALEGQEGRLFTPLAVTKTAVMAAAGLLAITLVPVLCGVLIRGKTRSEDSNPLNRLLKALYRPLLRGALAKPWLVVFAAVLIGLSAWYPASKLGSEFMPTLDEGDLLYMPTTLPGVSIQEAGQILQQTDRLIKTVPEVHSVFGKVGRAQTATDPAPLTMIETTIQLKPQQAWRNGVKLADIIAELEAKVQVPGLTNAWVQPIRTRIDMLSTGVKTAVGIQVSGPDLASIEQASLAVEQFVSNVEGTASVIADRPLAGRYIDAIPKRFEAARYGVTINDMHSVVRSAIGGETLTQSVQGNERFPINLRYPREFRSDVQALKELPFVAPSGAWVTLQQVADINITSGPSLIKSENGRMIAWVFVDLEQGVPLGDYVNRLQEKLDGELSLPSQTTYKISGQFEYLKRVKEKLQWIVPATLVIIFSLLYLAFASLWQAALVLATLPVALAGSLWLIYWLDYQLSVSVAVGMIALAGVAAEFGVVMLLYLNQALTRSDSLEANLQYGALQRVRPKAMTVLTIVASLLPIMLLGGSGNEAMERIAAPMLGGMLLCPLISMILIPSVYKLVMERVGRRSELIERS